MHSTVKKSVFYKLLISYILSSLIPLCIMGGIFYFMQVSNAEKEVSASNLSKLTQVRDQIDFYLRELLEASRKISTIADIIDLSRKTDSYKAAQIPTLLLPYKDRHPLVEEIMLYQRGDKIVYTSGSEYYYATFQDEIIRNINWDRTNFFKSINTIMTPTMIRFESYNETQPDSGRLIAYMFPMPYEAASPSSTIVYFIKESSLISIFQNFFGDYQGYSYIFNSYNDVLFSYSKGVNTSDMASIEKELRQYKGAGVFNLKFAGKEFMGMRIVSKETGWSYIVAMPILKFYEYANSMRTFMLVIISIFIVAGLSFALFMSINNYKPIKTLLNQNRELSTQIDIQKPLIKDECLLKIIKGKVKDEKELDYLLKCSNILLKGNCFFAVVLAVQQMKETTEIIEKALNLVETLYFSGGTGYGVELVDDKSIAVVISLEESDENIQTQRQTITHYYHSLLEKNLGCNFSMGVGNVYESIFLLKTSFLEASAALHHDDSGKASNIRLFSDIENSYQGQINWYPITEQALFIQSLKLGDSTACLSALESMVEKIAKSMTSYLMIKCICFDIINNLIKTANQMKLGYVDADFKGLAEFATLEEFKVRMKDFVVKMCNAITKYKENRSNELKNNIILYVTDNYKESSLSLEQIADRFNISKTYLSRFFKEETGLNFIEYLTNLRMDEVRKQLRTTRKPIKDIINEVGYIDATSFIRRFKSIEGVTPGQYKHINKE